MSDMVSLTIDGKPVEVEKGTLIIRAAEKAGIRIPRFCDHPLLKPAGACRQCLVEVAAPDREGNVRPFPKPQASCTMTVMPGMIVNTQHTSEVAHKAQRGVMELLLINHPLDCPVCDKGGECPLQNQALSEGRKGSRFADVKRVYPKPVTLTSQILLDRDRCILCQRCVRFAKEIAGDPFIDLQGRGGGSSPIDHHTHMGEQIGTFDTQVLGFSDPSSNPTGEQLSGTNEYAGPAGLPGVIGSTNFGPSHPGEMDESGRPFASYFSGNIIQICPVGALTSVSYRFRSRPFDLISTPSVTEHDASGAAIRIDARRGHVTRRLAGEDPKVNEEWISDKDRFAYTWQDGESRLRYPLVRSASGNLVPTSWDDALHRVADRVKTTRTGFLPGGRLTFEDAYAWAKFARVVAGTNDIDHRVRQFTSEEDQFLGAAVAGNGLDVTYDDIERAPHVLLIGFEPEDECATVFLRLRKGVTAGKTRVSTLAPFLSEGSRKLSAKLISAAPGTEPEVLEAIAEGKPFADLAEDLKGAIILVGERASQVRGLLSAVSALVGRVDGRVAWIPRRAGERGGVEAGTLPGLLPFGRTVADPAARVDIEAAWNVALPTTTGRDSLDMLRAAKEGSLNTLVLGGVDLRDFPDPTLAHEALESVEFVVSLEVNESAVTRYADVVLPVAPPVEKPGTFINWEGRLRPFGQALSSQAIDDRQVMNMLAQTAGVDLGLSSLKELYAEVNELMDWDGPRTALPSVPAAPLASPVPGTAVLATHKSLIDDALTLTGADSLRASARRPVARLSHATAAAVGVANGSRVRISSERGAIELPAVITDMPDKVVWVPQNNGNNVYQSLGEGGSLVSLEALEVTK